jgi:pectinesterase
MKNKSKYYYFLGQQFRLPLSLFHRFAAVKRAPFKSGCTLLPTRNSVVNSILIFITFFSFSNGFSQEKLSSADAKKETYKVVSQDGTGDYKTIQEAINDAKAFPYKRITIFIKNGIYKEKVKIHEWNTNISLVGESKEKTIITYNDYFNKIGLGRNSTFYTYTLLVEANDCILQNITIENSSGDVGQAVALSVFSNNVAVINCRILGNQDTLYASGIGKQYYKNCYIEGTTDFIFGSATAFFDTCEIRSLKDSYVTAASTPQGTEFGYVFHNCKLTSNEATSKVYLGRPWRIYAKTVFIDCDLGKHILPEGWHNWSKPEAEKTSFYAEYSSDGEGNLPRSRVKWAHKLQKSEAKKYTIENVLGSEFAKTITQLTNTNPYEN